MKKQSTRSNSLKLLLAIVTLLLTTIQLKAQQLKPTASGLAPANGIKVYYEVYGKGKPIILLHGAFMTIEGNWSQLIPELAKTRKVIAIEMQGHGHTPYSDRKFTNLNLAKDVAGVLDYLKVDSADFAGYSMGGSVAYQFAILYPKRVNKLVIISSTYKSTGWVPEIADAFKSFKPELFDNSPMKTAYDAVAPDKTKWSKFIAQMIIFAGEPFDMGDANIAKIKAPVLIIAGDNDGLDKVELGKTYKLLGGGVSADMQPMPKSQLAIVPSQSHVGLMMQSSTILAYMNSFLK
ncbi:alpha/beta hydrolase [Mucilaginibacter achroorhodeus]|uniref:Alpha/beta hydrolase n=1 Tax=Mucilaginibacter achroorhodeus TaxID=2599294 RepID=A0A563UBE7_9SPHI|nr:alpha/beta hydrolase [Mucilaginibacter achroorhodeus]TWR28613.1 alpha/beta hydrolase [Mucilaginibacter achroorhodeus]